MIRPIDNYERYKTLTALSLALQTGELSDRKPIGFHQQSHLGTRINELIKYGNVLVMRTALESVENWCVQKLGFRQLHVTVEGLLMIVRNALATPLRNCDRFDGDKDKLIGACLRERGLLVTEDFPDVFCDWLLDTATEKGGAA